MLSGQSTLNKDWIPERRAPTRACHLNEPAARRLRERMKSIAYRVPDAARAAYDFVN